MTLKLWHGGRRWQNPPEIKASSKGRAGVGTGIYLTTHYDTAQKYSKGGGRIMLVELNADLVWLESARIDVEALKWFTKDMPGLKNKQSILDDLDRVSNRLNKTDIPASCIVNLFVNHDVSHRKSGLNLTAWLASHQIDASLQHHGDEDWVVVYNPMCIKRMSIISSELEHLRYTDFNPVKIQMENLQESSMSPS